MAASDAVVAHTAFDALQIGRSSQFVVGRVLRFWDSKNIKKQGQFMGITLLLLDEKDCVIHGFIPAGRAPFYRPILRAGSVVKVSRFEVARSSSTYKITEHPFLLRFLPQTTIDEVQDFGPFINDQKFMLRQYDQLEALANTNLELPDVVGQIHSVQGSDLKDDGVMTRVVVRFIIAPSVVVSLSLWDDAAAMFRGIINTGDKTKSVMVVTTVNPKMFGGNLYLNSTPGTKFYLDTSLPAIEELRASLGRLVGAAFPCIDTKDGIKKKELLSIGELNKFISTSNEQEADFLCKARVLEVLQDNGWSFVSCTGCNRKVERSGTSLHCNRCATSNITGVIKFRVELSVDDGNDSATFLVFDREMVKLTKRDASGLTLDQLNSGGSEELPECLSELAGKEFVFQIRVTPYNFTPNHRTFTVAGISQDIPSETFNTSEAKVVYGEDGETSGSVKSKEVGESDESNPPSFAVKESGRKRPRE